MNPGKIVEGMPYQEYEKQPGINGSILAMVATNPMKTVRGVMNGSVNTASEEKEFGTVFHSLLLEGKREYILQPATYPDDKGNEKKWNYQANFCKDWLAALDKTVLTEQEERELNGMVEAVLDEPSLKDHLHGKKELSLFAEKDGQPLKGRLDQLPDVPILDFKKTMSADPDKFIRQAWNFAYFDKAAFYIDLLRKCGDSRKDFWFVAVEQKEPFNVYVCQLQDTPVSFIHYGRKRYQASYEKLMSAIKSNWWPSYGASEAEMHAQKWMIQEIEAAS